MWTFRHIGQLLLIIPCLHGLRMSHRGTEASSSSSSSSSSSRRRFLSSFASSAAAGSVLRPAPSLADDPSTSALNRQLLEKGVNPFNSACMGFGCSDANGLEFGGKPKPPPGVDSISYPDFLQALKDKKVSFVEFSAGMNDAYATITDVNNGAPILIGEGYPIEKGDGWSSPLFVVRTLDNMDVPHKVKFEYMKKR